MRKGQWEPLPRRAERRDGAFAQLVGQMGRRLHSQLHVPLPLFMLIRDCFGIEPADDDLKQVAIQFRQGDRYPLLMKPEDAADSTIDMLLDEAGGTRVGLLKAL